LWKTVGVLVGNAKLALHGVCKNLQLPTAESVDFSSEAIDLAWVLV
jgi:hypothetical protein